MPTDHVIESLQGFATLDDLISLLREKPDCSVVIINDLGNPIGVMHDFDVRHALAHSVRTDVALCELMSTDFTCVTENEYIALATLKPFKTKSETLIVLDDTGTAVRVKKPTSQNKSQSQMPPLLLIAGGYGVRMGELTKHTPKPMLIVNDKPIISHIVHSAIARGTKIYIAVHHLADQIENYFGDGSQFKISIEYIREKTPLGTGGCFKELPVQHGPVIVCNADILCNVSFNALVNFHEELGFSATVAVANHTIKNPFGVVKSDGFLVVDQEEKPVWITSVNAGLYVIDADTKRFIKPDENITMPDVIKRLIKKQKKVAKFPIFENWADIGSRASYLKHR